MNLLSSFRTQGNQVACNDDAQGLQSRVQFLAARGTTYYVQVGGFNGAVGNLVANFTQNPGPASAAPGAPARPIPMSALARAAFLLALFLAAANAVTTFVEYAPLVCPNNPERYWLLP